MQRARALVVDDDPHILELVRRALQDEGVACDVAPDGGAALEMLGVHSYVVIILDLRMPKLDGLAVLTALAHAGTRPFLVVMTGHLDEHRPELTPELVDVIIRKPFDVDALACILRDVVTQLVQNRRLEH